MATHTKLALLSALFLCGVLCLMAGTAQAQYPGTMAGLPRIVNYKPGYYQLTTTSWQAAELYLETSGQLRVRLAEGKTTTVYQPGEIAGFVLKADTFGVVRNVDLPSRRLAAAFAQQLYHYGRFTAFKLDHRYTGEGDTTFGDNLVVPAGAMELVLQPATGDAVLVPAGRGAFTKTMLPLVGDCPELAAQITKGKVGRQHMRQILQTYARWQKETSQPVIN